LSKECTPAFWHGHGPARFTATKYAMVARFGGDYCYSAVDDRKLDGHKDMVIV